MDLFASLEKRIEVAFRNKTLLWQAMTHRSYLNENRSWSVPNNERLEYLGDAVIELVVADYLLKAFPTKEEGELTQIRGVLVGSENLATVAKELILSNYLLRSRGEVATATPRSTDRLLENAYEALVGAIYSDQGFGAAQMFVKRTLMPRLIDILAANAHRDPKSVLQEEAQALLSLTPIYKTLEQTGPSHSRTFVVGVFFKSDLVARGEGASKKEAETQAAKAALEERGWGVAAQASRRDDKLFAELVRKAKQGK